MNIQQKKIVLTGASGGIGRAFAHMLDRQGAYLTLVGRNITDLQMLNEQLGNRHYIVVADLGSAAGRDTVSHHCSEHGIDILINNAGISEFGLLEQQEQARIEQLINTNLLAPILLTQSLLPLLKKADSGMIINIGSTFGSIGYPGFSSYSASKFGIRGFTESLRRELADSRVKVLYLAPRATRTAINSSAVERMNSALGNAMDEPSAVAEELRKVISRNTGCRYLGWPENLFVRLNSLLPWLVDIALHKQLPVIRQFLHQRA